MNEPLNTFSSSGGQAAPAGSSRVDPLEWPVLLQPPARVEMPLAWAGHIPFAMLLVHLARPRLVVELGTHSGNSYNAFCQAVDSLGLPARCYAVDTWVGDPHAGNYDTEVYDQLRAYQESRYGHFSTLLKMTFDEAAARFEPGTIDLLHIDGLHTYEAVRHDFETWLPKLSDRAVVLFHDTTVHQADFGVWRFWRELQSRYRSLEFPHSNGLGVLAVGHDVPPALLRLIDLEGSARHSFFALIERLGNSVMFERQVQDQEARIRALTSRLSTRETEVLQSGEQIARLTNEVKGLENQVDGLENQVDGLENQVDGLVDQIDGLTAELKRKEREVAAYLRQLAAAEASLAQVFASHSWRLTQPIRAASGMFRHIAHRALRAAYRLYTLLLPLSIRIQARPLVRPLARYIRARYTPAASGYKAPFDYVRAVATADRPAPVALAFAENPAPRISIVVVDEEGPHQTLRGLNMLQQEDGIAECELIVVAADPSVWSAQIKGARLERGGGALPDGYARGAALARGAWILCMSGATRPLTGMLTEILKLIAETKEMALAVPKLVSEDAQLVFPIDRAGTLDPNLPEINFTCPADRCPAAAFLLNKACLGNGEALRRADREMMIALVDTMRKQGGRILYAPGMHAMVPAGALPADSAHWGPGDAEAGQRVLVLDLHTPTPDMDSGSVDAYFQMKILNELGYRVTFAAGADPGYRPRYTADLQRIGVECLYAPYTPSIPDHLRQQGRRYDYVVLSRLHTAEEFIDTVREECPDASIMFNTVDLHFLREQRQAELTGDRIMARHARHTRRRELGVMMKAAATLVISDAEEALLRREAPAARIFHLPLIMSIEDRTGTAFEQRKNLFFIGGYRHLPNVDGVLHFVADIWPRIRDRLPGVRFHIVGSHAPPEILDLAGPDIVVDGFVPDAARFFNDFRLSVAPLRFGAGLKGKVGRTLGYGCPVVLSPLAAEGMALTDGRHALIAENAEKFADAVVRLYQDEALWNTLSQEGMRFFEDHFSVEVGKARMAAILETISA